MTTAITGLAHAPSQSPIGALTAIAGSIAILLQRLSAWRARRATIIALRSLDDRMLDDIGLERSQIDTTAWALGARLAGRAG